MILPLTIGVSLAQAAVFSNEVTVYNQGFALIKEVREFNLKSGRQVVAVENVASMIEPSSVALKSLTDSGSIEVLEQNYQYDLINPIAILNKAVGQRIKFLRVLPNGVKETLEGVLVSSPTAIVNDGNGSQQTWNGMVVKTDDGRILLNPSGEIEVSSIPDGLISRPTLLWDLESSRAGKNSVELSYLTQGISWSADYVLTLDEKAPKANLKGWVTVNNQSGATYKDAKLKLLAGDVQRAPEAPMGRAGGFGGRAENLAKDTGFAEEALFEYHLYTLQRPATVKEKETKQLSLLEGDNVGYEKKLIVDSMRDFGMYYPSEGQIGVGDVKPMVRVEFENTKANNLGMPLPKGKVKVYQRDKSGSVQMLGEDAIEHTPKDERISLFVGRSFDVVATRKRTNFNWLDHSSSRGMSEDFEIEVRNRKEEATTVHVYERHYGDYKITKKSQDFTKLEAFLVDFVVNLKAGESKKITYTVETRW